MATYTVSVDWNDDGDYSDTGEDVTDRTLARTPLTVRYGRDQARALAPIAVGEARFELDNASRDYSPENGSSPLAGNVLPARPVLTKANHSGSDYNLINGRIDDFDLLPAPARRSIEVTVLDALGQLKQVDITTSLYQGIRTGEAIGCVLDAAGWPADKRDLDPGATVLPYWWVDQRDAYQALMDLMYSEGLPALITSDPDGNVVFHDRHHRLLNSVSISSQATWRDTGSEPLFSDLRYGHGFKEIVNVVTFEVPVRQRVGSLSVVWSIQGLLTIASGETLEVTARASNPFIDAVTPVSGTDYTVVSGTVEVTLSRTSGQSITVYAKATSGAAVISDLQVRGYEIETMATLVVTATDANSISNYGRRSLPSGHEPVWAGVHDARDIASIIIAHRAERLPTVSVTFAGGDSTRLTQQLSRDLSDRVTVVDAETALNDPFYVEQIAHTLAEAGKLHLTEFGLEKAAVQPSNVLILNDAAEGILDTNVLGIKGLDDPTTVLVLDTDLLDSSLLGH